MYARPVADVAPFRAVRFAHPTPKVTAPPYDVLTPELRAAYLARDPHNVVHLTLNDSEDEAGAALPRLAGRGDSRAGRGASRVGGGAGLRRPGRHRPKAQGLVASLRVEPYATRTVLPHERTHAGPKEGRLRLLRAARAQLEPIFLLYDGEPPVAVPGRVPDLATGESRLWRISGEDGFSAFFAGKQLHIADGHHPYETAVAYAAEEGTKPARG